uniref:Putative secreted protein n=1 Tax=Ixodes ricinus TaxID=34613 RepID=A0A6B0URA0_IXORI
MSRASVFLRCMLKLLCVALLQPSNVGLVPSAPFLVLDRGCKESSPQALCWANAELATGCSWRVPTTQLVETGSQSGPADASRVSERVSFDSHCSLLSLEKNGIRSDEFANVGGKPVSLHERSDTSALSLM